MEQLVQFPVVKVEMGLWVVEQWSTAAVQTLYVSHSVPDEQQCRCVWYRFHNRQGDSLVISHCVGMTDVYVVRWVLARVEDLIHSITTMLTDSHHFSVSQKSGKFTF